MEWLCREKGVRFFWIADENPTTIKEVWRDVLAEVARRGLGVGMCASIRAQDIVRDADILHLYKAAGFTYVLMGIETVTDETLARVRKGASVDDGYRAVRLLRQHGIMSIVDYIFGLDEETPRTIWRGLRGLHRYDGDFVNALYVTPHSWTPLGHAMAAAEIVEAGPVEVGLPPSGRRRQGADAGATVPRRQAGRTALPPAPAPAVACAGRAGPRAAPAAALRVPAHHEGVLVRGV